MGNSSKRVGMFFIVLSIFSGCASTHEIRYGYANVYKIFATDDADGIVIGQVLSQEGIEPWPLAEVRLQPLGAVDTTDMNGYFAFLHVQPGTYAVSVSAVGAKLKRSPEFEIHRGDIAVLEFELADVDIFPVY